MKQLRRLQSDEILNFRGSEAKCGGTIYLEDADGKRMYPILSGGILSIKTPEYRFMEIGG